MLSQRFVFAGIVDKIELFELVLFNVAIEVL